MAFGRGRSSGTAAASLLACGWLPSRCRGPGHFLLRAQEKVTKEKGTPQRRPSGLCGSAGLFDTTSLSCRKGIGPADAPAGLFVRAAPPLRGPTSRARAARSAALAFGIRRYASPEHVRWWPSRRIKTGDAPASQSLPQFGSRRDVAAAHPRSDSVDSSKVQPCSASIPGGMNPAISLGHLSLGQQRKVARWPAGQRKPAAGEPGHGSATSSDTVTGSRPAPG
jgi:hypothetical protein